MSEHTPERLVYVDATDAQVRWGSNDDPRGILVPGKSYAVASVDVRSSHTKVELVAFPGKRFNSVCFKQEHAAISERDSLRAVNAELLEALEKIEKGLEDDGWYDSEWETARAAIASARKQENQHG